MKSCSTFNKVPACQEVQRCFYLRDIFHKLPLKRSDFHQLLTLQEFRGSGYRPSLGTTSPLAERHLSGLRLQSSQHLLQVRETVVKGASHVHKPCYIIKHTCSTAGPLAGMWSESWSGRGRRQPLIQASPFERFKGPNQEEPARSWRPSSTAGTG